MDKKLNGTLLGVAAVSLWFMPLVNFEFMGMHGTQAGQQIGGIAYLLLLASLCYAGLSWAGQHVPRIIAGAVALGVSVLFVIQAGTASAWGLYGLLLVSAGCVVLAVFDNRRAAAAIG